MERKGNEIAKALAYLTIAKNFRKTHFITLYEINLQTQPESKHSSVVNAKNHSPISWGLKHQTIRYKNPQLNVLVTAVAKT